MQDFDNILRVKFLLNDIESWLWFLGILLLGFLLKRLLSILVSKLVYILLKHETGSVGITECVELLRKPIEFLITLTIISLAFDELIISTKLRILPLGKMRLNNFVESTMDALFIVSITWIVIRVIKFFALVYKRKALETESRTDEHIVPFVRDILIAIVIFASFFFVLGYVFKQNVASLITGLGIGGVAVALAARETLENFFASFTLFTDQPFIVGDDIEIGNLVGNVEKVGFRSTKIRNVDGSFITVPNKMLVTQVMNNLSQRRFRRVKHLLHLKFDTPISTIKSLTKEIQDLLQNHEQTTNHENTFVKFDAFGEYSLNIMVVYFVNTSNYNDAKVVKEAINFSISAILEKNKVKLVQPATSLFTAIDERNLDGDY